MQPELPDRIPSEPAALDPADLVAGILASGHGRIHPGVLRAACLGLEKYFPQLTGMIVVSGVLEEAGDLALEVSGCRVVVLPACLDAAGAAPFPFHGVPWKAAALHQLLRVAVHAGARACAVVEGDVHTITPEWFDLLLRPIVLGGYDWVAPRYHRHKHDGGITHGLAYPLLRALFGWQVREPLGGEFAASARFIRRLVAEDDWQRPAIRVTPGLWMTTVAVAESYRVCQSFLGARLRNAAGPVGGLAGMLAQISDSLFRLMEDYESVWRDRRGSRPTDTFGHRFELALEVSPDRADAMAAAFASACGQLEGVWSEVLLPETLDAVRQTASRANNRPFRFENELWTRIVFEFAVAHRVRPHQRAWLLPSLAPLYLGWLASFLQETRYLVSSEVEERIEDLCRCFERDKLDLVQLWTGGSPSYGKALAPSPRPVEVET
ncbi:MAG: hypothetical protein RMK57_14420 [Bryobacterales bacterium]|nr:hypothetical protein [Bryobacteraceae bacterium]MDW8355715.1 hypothetical protein [Bryobacterales bacterium]